MGCLRFAFRAPTARSTNEQCAFYVTSTQLKGRDQTEQTPPDGGSEMRSNSSHEISRRPPGKAISSLIPQQSKPDAKYLKALVI